MYRKRTLILLMLLSFLLGLAVFPTVWVGKQFVAAYKATSISFAMAMASEKVQLSDKVSLIATSGTNVMLVDEVEFSMLPGDVVLADYVGRDKQVLLVVYIAPGGINSSSDDVLNRLEAAEVDLATAQVTKRSAVGQKELAYLQGVFEFMHQQ